MFQIPLFEPNFGLIPILQRHQLNQNLSYPQKKISPLPQPKIKLQYAINVLNEPTDGIKAFARRAEPETTLVDVENGKFIFPPGIVSCVFIQP